MIQSSALTLLSMGAIFGLTAGISPGPLLALVITETLKHNRREGFKVAITPLLTDLPVIIATWYILSRLTVFNLVLSIISFSGGIYFAYLGYKTFTTSGMDKNLTGRRPASLKKGITANILNPNPYIFWLTAGMPTALKAFDVSTFTAVLYFFLFYLMLVGSKLTVAFLVDRTRSFLENRFYNLLMKGLGILLVGFSLLFIYDGFRILNHN